MQLNDMNGRNKDDIIKVDCMQIFLICHSCDRSKETEGDIHGKMMEERLRGLLCQEMITSISLNSLALILQDECLEICM